MVVGGGPAGTAVALELRARGRQVLLVELSSYDRWRAGEVLAPEAEALLTQLDIALPETSERPLRGIAAMWGSDTLTKRPSGLGGSTGRTIDRRGFDALLASAAEERGVRVMRGTRLVGLDCHGSVSHATLQGPHGRSEVQARYLVDASGRSGAVGSMCGAQRIRHDRLVAYLAKGRPRQEVEASSLLVEAVEEGWWYSTPLPDGQIIVAFMTDTDLCSARELVRTWERRISDAHYTTSRVTFSESERAVLVRDATTSRLWPSRGRGWVAIGDSAHAHDPLSARGICHALGSGISAARAVDQGLDGHDSALEEFARTGELDFQDYLDARRVYYAQERRWPHSPFWRRRADSPPETLYLSPHETLCAAPRHDRYSRAATEALVPPIAVARILRACSRPTKAHDIVSQCHAAIGPRFSSRLTILALQALVRDGALQVGDHAQ